MKLRIVMLLAGLLACGEICAGEENLFPDPEMNQPAKWYLCNEQSFGVDPATGERVLVVRRTDPGAYMCGGIGVTLPPGRYRVGCKVKSDDGGTMCIEYRQKNGEYGGGNYPRGFAPSPEYKQLNEELLVTEDMADITICFYLLQGVTGSAFYKDFFIAPAPELTAFLLVPAMGSRVAAGPNRLIFGYSWFGAAPASAAVELIADGNTAASAVVPAAGNRVVCDLGIPEFREAFFRITLRNAGGAAVAAATVPVFPEPATPPEGRVTLARNGALLVNGEKFLPIGVYTSHLDDFAQPDFGAMLDELAAAGFNCILPYDAFYWTEGQHSVSNLTKLIERLDLCLAKGVKMCLPMENVPDDQLGPVAARLKSHPAFLAWYLRDEPNLREAETLIRRRQLLNAADPDHPAVVVFSFYSAYTAGFGGASDIYAFDSYDIGKKNAGPPHQRTNLMALQQLNAAFGHPEGVALWAVPQIFNWGAYADAAERGEYRAPTLGEMRGMLLLDAAFGVKGFIMYSWFDLFRPGVAESFDQRWPDVARVAGALGALKDFVLSETPASPVAIRVVSGEVYARGFMAADGRRAVVIAAIGPGAAEAEVQLDDAAGWHSEFGVARRNADGRWTVAVDGPDGDILWSK